MKNNKIKLRNILIAVMASVLCMSCDKMSLQKNYDYDGTALSPHVNMTAWEFMNSRTDIFSVMIEAVERAAMEDMYQQRDRTLTYLFIDNTGMNLFLNKHSATMVSQVSPDIIRKLLLYHIIDGEYHAYKKKLPVEPIYVKTMLEGEDGLMTIKVNKSSANSVGAPIANGNILINSTASNFASKSISSISSNIMPLNGIIHVFDNFAYYRKDLNYTPAF